MPLGLWLWPAYGAGLASPMLLFLFFNRMRQPPISWRAALIALLPGGVLVAYVTLWTRIDVYAPSHATALPTPFLAAATVNF